MSLLIKALEQAAKDRDSAKGVSASTPASSTEPTLEPPPAPRSPRSGQQPSTSVPAGGTGTGSALREPATQPGDARSADRASPEANAFAHIDAQQQRARAAAVVEASRSSGSMLFARVRGNPVMMFGTAAVVFGIGFGIYVYLQVARPGLFVQQAAQKPAENAPRAPAPQVSVGPSAPGSPGASSMDVSARSSSSESASIAAISSSSPTSASAALQPAVGQLAAVPERKPAPIPASAVIGNSNSRDVVPELAAPTQAAAIDAAPARERSTVPSAREARAHASQPATPAQAGGGRREQIAVSPTAAQPRIDPTLAQAYAALQTGKLEEARTSYAKLSQSEPLNVDALLGLAYIATQENRSDDAMRLYLRILQINPRHAAAQGALIGLMGRADPVASETRLKQLIAREPSPFLHFVLGNLYADQGMWAQAQLAYYQAHHLEPDNPDYAYNLAVGLDHLRQNKVAVGFYRRAEQLATALGRANFDVSHARERIGILSSQLE